jgi:hypothetical protein
LQKCQPNEKVRKKKKKKKKKIFVFGNRSLKTVDRRSTQTKQTQPIITCRKNNNATHQLALGRIETNGRSALLRLAGGGNDLGLNAVRRIDATGGAIDARQTAAPVSRKPSR